MAVFWFGKKTGEPKDYAKVKKQVNDNTANLNSITTIVNTLNTKVIALEPKVQDNTNTIAKHTNFIAQNTNNITALGVRVKALEDAPAGGMTPEQIAQLDKATKDVDLNKKQIDKLWITSNGHTSQIDRLYDQTINPVYNFDTQYDAYVLPDGREVKKQLVSRTGKGGTNEIVLLTFKENSQLISVEGSLLIHKYESNSYETRLLPDFEPNSYLNKAYITSSYPGTVGHYGDVKLHLENYGGKYDEITAVYWIYYAIEG